MTKSHGHKERVVGAGETCTLLSERVYAAFENENDKRMAVCVRQQRRRRGERLPRELRSLREAGNAR